MSKTPHANLGDTFVNVRALLSLKNDILKKKNQPLTQHEALLLLLEEIERIGAYE